MQNGHGRQSAAHLMFSIIAGWESDHEENHYYNDAYRLRKKGRPETCGDKTNYDVEEPCDG